MFKTWGGRMLKCLSFVFMQKQRLTALFLAVGVLAGTVLPTASAYALYRPNPDNPHIKDAPADANKPMKQDYPKGQAATTSQLKAATDAKPKESKESKAIMGEALQGITETSKVAARELVEKRTATSSSRLNQDGTITEEHSFTPRHFKKNGTWEVIDTKLVEDKNAGDAGNLLGRVWGQVRSAVTEEKTFQVKDNDWQARFAPSDAKEGLLRIKKGSEQIGFTPVNAKKGVAPVVTTTKDGQQTVHYYDLWPGVNVEYIVESAAVKENIVIKDKNATNQVSFKMLGASLEKPKEDKKDGPAFRIKGAFNDEFGIAPPNLILNNFGFVSNQSVFGQTYQDGVVTLSVDRAYLQNLPDKAFPAVIDPYIISSFGGSYVSFKDDGTVCYSNVCGLHAGTLDDPDGTPRAWRGAFHAPYSQAGNGNTLVNATLHLVQRSNESFWTGDGGWHTFDVGYAPCLTNIGCVTGDLGVASNGVTTSGDINVTGIYQQLITAGNYNGWLMLMGEDDTGHSFKNFDSNYSRVIFTYNGSLAAPTIATPTPNQVYVDPQVSFRANEVSNPNGSNPLQYEFSVSSGSDGSGTLIVSGKSNSRQWTVPDGILQDGSTYYVRSRSHDPTTPVTSQWGTAVPFRVDMRTGKDKTQTYDNLGPVDVDLATGNVTTSASSHTSSALGGSLGVGLNYNSPLRSRNGLVGQYWNNNNFTGDPAVTRVDQNIDVTWDTGAPAAGVNADNFTVRWKGHFIAPQTGAYQFGTNSDDGCKIWVNNQLILDGWTSCGDQYGTSINLTAGQIVPIQMDYKEATGNAYALLKVKGVMSTAGMTVPQAWLQTGVRPLPNQRGLIGEYFARLDGTNTFSAGNPKIMQRTDSHLAFDWKEEAPVANGPKEFLARWSGYVTVPATGTYTFGTRSDDGVKIMLDASNTPVYTDWTPHSAPASPAWGTGYMLTAGTPVRITVEYFDSAVAASFELWVKSTDANVTERIVPSDWLSPQAQVLPNGWSLGLDADGNLSYDRLTANQNSVVLTDSSGATHEYTWTGSGYKPPVNEDGQLMRNADGTFTLQDTDGRTYVFGVEGTLTSVTSAVDDRKPAALQYEYQAPGGGPARLYRIKDGVDPSRMATVYYSGQSDCGSPPSGFDTNAPTGMICAVKTNDNRATYFYYKDAQLARIAKPGNQMVDYQYEAVTNGGSTIGYRLISIRDSLANDAVAAGVRTNDDNVKTQLEYDILGRATTVKQPAPTTGASRMQHTIEYLPGASGYVDENGSSVPGYEGMTKQHVVGAAEPNGFSRRIKYDNLFRTIENTDVANLSSKAEWDPAKDLLLSSVDATGLKGTTIYDDEDRPVDGYGPAPAAWFGADRKPLSGYSAQVPHSQAGYEEGMTGPSVAWFDYSKPAGNPSGTLFGAPKLHTTGINTTSPGLIDATTSQIPITAGSGMQGVGFSATGKLRLPAGTYWLVPSDGIRVWVDDILVVDKWDGVVWPGLSGGSFTVSDTAPKRVRIDAYRTTGSTTPLTVSMQQAGGFTWTTDWSSYLKPGYGLTTSTKTFDSTVGDSTATVNYGSTPELGLPVSATADPTGLSLTSTAGYEQQGATGSYLRPTSKSRPGDLVNNPASTYSYYGATETRDNPCTPATESFKQAGMLKLTTAASPDGGTTPGRKGEAVYDDAGRIVATRTNTDGWACTTYDARGRAGTLAIPAYGSEAARTVTNNYAVWGDPTFTGAEDASGSVVTQVDLLGRTIWYHDAQWNETWTGYDSLGRMSSRTSPLGVESFVYDNYNRLTQQKLDNVTYAVVSYDQYNRIQNVEYPNAAGQKMVVSRDALGRPSGKTYYAGGSQTPGSNVIPNPSVEQVSGSDPNKPENWQQSAWGTNTPTFTYLNEGYTTNRSVKTEITSYTDGDAKWYFDPVAVSGNTTYTFKDYYKSNITTEAVVQYTHQNQSVSYQSLGNISASSNWTQSTHSFTTPATAVQATVFHLVAGVGWLIMDDAELYATNSGSQTIMASDTVTRSQSGRIISGTENGQAKSYTYDKAGRLTAATLGTNTYSYGFGTQNGSCAAGTNANSGKNSNRTTQTINGQTTTYCYDYADKLISSSDSLTNNAQYDTHGNTTSIGSGTTPLQLFYDSSDRNWGFQQTTSAGNGSASYYSRDVANRITYRETDTIASWNWTLTNQQWYGFIGSGDAASFVRNANWDITEKYLSLAGGVLVTIRPQQTGNANKVYSLPNMHGSVMATTDASGTLTGTFRYDPFGNKISTTFPDNTYAGATLGWAGSHEKLTEKDLTLTPIQMGARVYFPTLGRFAQIDPIPGGNANDYIYPTDPVNMSDFSGASGSSSIPLFNNLNPCILCGTSPIASLNRAVAAAIGIPAPVPYRAPARVAAPRAVAPVAKPTLGLAKVTSTQSAGTKAVGVVASAWNKLTSGYIRAGLDANFFAGAGGGVIVSKRGVRLYGSVSLNLLPGIGGSINYSTNHPPCGWGASTSGYAGIGGSVGTGDSWEIGGGTPGASIDMTYSDC